MSTQSPKIKSETKKLLLDKVEYRRRKLQWVAKRLEEDLSGNPCYAEKAASFKSNYWLNLAGSMPNRYLRQWKEYCQAEGIVLDNSLPPTANKNGIS